MLVLYVLLFFYVGWLNFIIYAGVAAKWNVLEHVVRVALLPVGAIGIAQDILFQWTFASLFMLDLPRELFFTQRLERLKKGPDGWRKKVGTWICANLLDPFQANHC